MPTVRSLLAFALMLCACPAAASAATSSVPPLPPQMPAIVAQDCPDLQGTGCADIAGMTAYIGKAARRFTTAHELGHFADAETLDAGEQNRWMTLVHAEPRTWWIYETPPGEATVISRASPAEQFADGYATCRLGINPDDVTRHRDGSMTSPWWSVSTTYAPRTDREQRRNCAFIARAMRTPVSP